MDRQQYFLNTDQNQFESLFVWQESYVSIYNGEVGKHEVTAKKALISYAYIHCWKRVIDQSRNYQCRTYDEGTHNLIWRIRQELSIEIVLRSLKLDGATASSESHLVVHVLMKWLVK